MKEKRNKSDSYPSLDARDAEMTAHPAELYPKHLNAVYGYLAHRVSSREDAEDLALEVFEAAFRSASSFRGDSAVLTWLIGIARRKLADHYRKRRRETCLEPLISDEEFSSSDLDSGGSESPDEALRRQAVADALRRAMDSLPKDQKEAILMHHAEGFTLQEICMLMNRSENSVKALLHRAKASLYRKLSIIEPSLFRKPAIEGEKLNRADKVSLKASKRCLNERGGCDER